MTWEILAAALLFVAGNVAYFEMALPSPTSLLPTQAVTSKRNVNRVSGTGTANRRWLRDV